MLSPCRDCASVGFSAASAGVIPVPSFEVAAMAQTLCLCRPLILFRQAESGAGLILIAGREDKLSATLAKNACRSGRNISLTVICIRSPVNVFLLASCPVGATIRRCYIFFLRNGVRTWPITSAKAIIDDLRWLNEWLFISSVYRPIIPDP